MQPIFLRPLSLLTLFLALWSCSEQTVQNEEDDSTKETSKPEQDRGGKPNIVVVYCDDLGYGDLKLFHDAGLSTPNLEALAGQGVVLDNFYSASPVCSPSRAALLTGCYPPRIGVPKVLAPHGISWAEDRWRTGLNPEEETLPELLKKVGYRTALIGKWHLGHLPEHMPTEHGFDRFYGLPYSNDMLPEIGYPPLPIIDQDKIVEEGPDQSQLTKRLTEKALTFVEQSKDKPFFLYLAHPMPHVPIFASDSFQGKTGQGLYKDVVQEIDWSVGQIVEDLKAKGLFQNTIMVFTSDNGPWLCFGNHGGSAGELREGKHTTFDGGQRVPFILSWPNNLKPMRSSQILSMMDLLPTIMEWVDGPQPTKEIDGYSATAFLTKEKENSPRETLIYYHGNEPEAFRSGDFKLHLPHKYKKKGDQTGIDGERGQYDDAEIGLELFNIAQDPRETEDLAAQKPALRDSLKAELLEQHQQIMAEKRPSYQYPGEAPPNGQLWHK